MEYMTSYIIIGLLGLMCIGVIAQKIKKRKRDLVDDLLNSLNVKAINDEANKEKDEGIVFPIARDFQPIKECVPTYSVNKTQDLNSRIKDLKKKRKDRDKAKKVKALKVKKGK